jgi:hypothetical protein
VSGADHPKIGKSGTGDVKSSRLQETGSEA